MADITNRSPYYKIILDKSEVDLTEYVSMFSFEDATDVDSLITLQLKNSSIDFLDEKDISKGDILSIQFGYIKGESSRKIKARIADTVPTYAAEVTVKIIATDLGILIKKNESKKIWSGKASDIVKNICQAYGLIPIVDETTTDHEFLPQGGRTDYEFIKYLASIEEDGSFRFYLRGQELHFTRLDLTKASIQTFTYGDGDGNVLKFIPADRETLKNAASRNTIVESVDPFTGEIIQQSVTNSNAADDDKLGDYIVHFNENAVEVATIKSAAIENENNPNRNGKQLNIPVVDAKHAENVANKIKKDAALDDVTSKLHTVGSPRYAADQVITMAGVGKRDAGNWYVKRVNHMITQSGGYVTVFDLQKNAIAKATTSDGTVQDNVNKTIGKDTGENKKEVDIIFYDEDSKIVDIVTSSDG